MSHPTKKIVRAWSDGLKDAGFRLNGSSLQREAGILRHNITLQRSQRVAPGKIRINLYLSIRDDFIDPPDFVSCLHGSVGQKKAEFGDDESWWEEGRLVSSGLSALCKHGLCWFDKFGKDTKVLAGWLERAITERVSIRDLVEERSRAHPEIENMIAPYLIGRGRNAPADYRMFLSILKFDQGQLEIACQYAQAFLESIRRREVAFSNEPERTLRQLRKMGCVKSSSDAIH